MLAPAAVLCRECEAAEKRLKELKENGGLDRHVSRAERDSLGWAVGWSANRRH